MPWHSLAWLTIFAYVVVTEVFAKVLRAHKEPPIIHFFICPLAPFFKLTGPVWAIIRPFPLPLALPLPMWVPYFHESHCP